MLSQIPLLSTIQSLKSGHLTNQRTLIWRKILEQSSADFHARISVFLAIYMDAGIGIIESVDSICRDGTDTPISLNK